MTLGRASDLMRGNRAFGFDGPMGSGNTFMYRTRPGQNFRDGFIEADTVIFRRFDKREAEKGAEKSSKK